MDFGVNPGFVPQKSAEIEKRKPSMCTDLYKASKYLNVLNLKNLLESDLYEIVISKHFVLLYVCKCMYIYKQRRADNWQFNNNVPVQNIVTDYNLIWSVDAFNGSALVNDSL